MLMEISDSDEEYQDCRSEITSSDDDDYYLEHRGNTTTTRIRTATTSTDDDTSKTKNKKTSSYSSPSTTAGLRATTITSKISLSEEYALHKACFDGDLETLMEFIKFADELVFIKNANAATHQAAASVNTVDRQNVSAIKSNSKMVEKTMMKTRILNSETTGDEESGDIDIIKVLLNSFDSRGNCPIHVACIRSKPEIVKALCECSLVEIDKKNANGWKPLDEAIHATDRQSAIYLATAKKKRERENLDKNSPELMERLMEAPDFQANLTWELVSPIFGPILKRLAPSDTYQLTKIGTRVRIDGQFRGIEDIEEISGTYDENNSDVGDNNSSTSRGERLNSLEDMVPTTTFSERGKDNDNMKSRRNNIRGARKRGLGLLPVWHQAPFSILFLTNQINNNKEAEQEEEERKVNIIKKGTTTKRTATQKTLSPSPFILDSGGKIEDVDKKETWKSAILYLDHGNKKCIDALEKPNLANKTDHQSDFMKDVASITLESQIEAEIDLILVEGPSRGVYETKEWDFAPVQSWGSYFGITEQTKIGKVDGRYAKVMEARGKASETRKYRSGHLPTDENYDFECYANDSIEYKDKPLYRDYTKVRSVGKKRDENDDYIDPSKRSKKKLNKTDSNRSIDSATSSQRKEKEEDIDDGTRGRKMSCRIWLVENFPLKVKDLLPVIEVAAQANKYLKRFKTLLTSWESEPSRQAFFPVKCSIPIMMTVHFEVLLHNFKVLSREESDRLQFEDKIFTVPENYDSKGLDETMKDLEDKFDKLEATVAGVEEGEIRND
jgi:hypothetical protein